MDKHQAFEAPDSRSPQTDPSPAPVMVHAKPGQAVSIKIEIVIGEADDILGGGKKTTETIQVVPGDPTPPAAATGVRSTRDPRSEDPASGGLLPIQDKEPRTTDDDPLPELPPLDDDSFAERPSEPL